LWPRTAEQETALSGSGGEPHIFSQFCPEVVHDRFGWFATSLAAYPDELDRDFAHAALSRSLAKSDDWHWAWWQMTPMHYSECPLYSVLSRTTNDQLKPEILELKPNFQGIGINLRALWRWFTNRD
jgi:hypothetical protein